MTYEIVGRDGQAVVEVPCDEKFAVQGWALEWAGHNADTDEYIIRRDRRDWSKLYRTAGGQWYLMNA
ncbi:hypothetical protein [Sphingomonas sp. Root710]|uniref:hypothetical protein n=1 Tax=Sphingomonas sp. Root710 TaxID=1736594 RepID=UPI000A75A06F|nr:hypothetical protein [Sphingomonas sp. Root710]